MGDGACALKVKRKTETQPRSRRTELGAADAPRYAHKPLSLQRADAVPPTSTHYNFWMRFRLVILLLVLLPLQQSWATLGPYCGEARVHAGLALAALCCDHSGVGENASALPGSDAGTASTDAAGAADFSTCHANGTAALFMFGTIATSAFPSARFVSERMTLRPVHDQRPERPQWQALV